MKNFDIKKNIPAYIRNMESYQVGENISSDYIKLNSNENPYRIPKKIIKKVLKDLKDINFSLYPDDFSTQVRSKAGEVFGLKSENILVCNGSASILSLIFRLFVGNNSKVALITPTFPYYNTLLKIQDANLVEFKWKKDFSLPLKEIRNTNFDILFLPNPNAPTGHRVDIKSIEKLLKLGKIIVIDEAYYEFSGETCISLLSKYDNLIIVRTFSKSQSSASLRIGFCLANKMIIENMDKIRPINNFNIISQKLAYYILDNYSSFNENIRKIKKNRTFLEKEIRKRNFEVIKSYGNFILVKPLYKDSAFWYKKLKKRKILIRYFPKLDDFNLRISIGKRKDNKQLLNVIDTIFKFEEIK